MTRPHTLRTPAVGRTIAVVGDVYRFLATGADTDGGYALWEAVVPPGGGPPPHVHSREEEGFYVLEGEIALHVGDERVVVAAGSFANVPVGTAHSFKNESTRTARMLVSVAPAGLEEMFFEVGVPLARGAMTALPPTKDEVGRLLAVAPSVRDRDRVAGAPMTFPRRSPLPEVRFDLRVGRVPVLLHGRRHPLRPDGRGRTHGSPQPRPRAGRLKRDGGHSTARPSSRPVCRRRAGARRPTTRGSPRSR
jgi:mannose-6-phosphate isomerase-like protein (cupin superfamily)